MRVDNKRIEGIVRRYGLGIPGRKESGERLLEMCSGHELLVGNGLLRKEDVHK